ncbi:MAG: hypothetical protein O2819_05640 [Planctomycetota bacterium]|nr:hypothetical protein [Planctomycetota bacterium]
MGLAVFTCILVCLSALACGIGIFFIGYPYGIAVVGVAYNDLFPGPTKELDVVVVGARPPMVDG